ncbi:MAG: hypothetical protein CMM52_07530 [Rhodospirillaceae bacterium]|nr:hypothetical protein [Rhodospirillaceae bacterium]|tara:strand:+ start:17527 stop:17832 length:306 start_codon:yes stop_codon:yes gene_type:complete
MGAGKDRNETAVIQEATDFVENTVEFVEQDLSLDLRRYMPNALLNVAVIRLLTKEGRDRTVNILDSLSYAVATGADADIDGPLQIARKQGSVIKFPNRPPQ